MRVALINIPSQSLKNLSKLAHKSLRLVCSNRQRDMRASFISFLLLPTFIVQSTVNKDMEPSNNLQIRQNSPSFLVSICTSLYQSFLCSEKLQTELTQILATATVKPSTFTQRGSTFVSIETFVEDLFVTEIFSAITTVNIQASVTSSTSTLPSSETAPSATSAAAFQYFLLIASGFEFPPARSWLRLRSWTSSPCGSSNHLLFSPQGSPSI